MNLTIKPYPFTQERSRYDFRLEPNADPPLLLAPSRRDRGPRRGVGSLDSAPPARQAPRCPVNGSNCSRETRKGLGALPRRVSPANSPIVCEIPVASGSCATSYVGSNKHRTLLRGGLRPRPPSAHCARRAGRASRVCRAGSASAPRMAGRGARRAARAARAVGSHCRQYVCTHPIPSLKLSAGVPCPALPSPAPALPVPAHPDCWVRTVRNFFARRRLETNRSEVYLLLHNYDLKSRPPSNYNSFT